MLGGNTPETFLDTDVAFDIISKRMPYHATSVKLLELAAKGDVQLMISEASLANLFYLTYDIYKIRDATAKLTAFISSCLVVPAGKAIALLALASPFSDKEDALQYYSALHAGADYFITRNLKDYRHASAPLPVYTPDRFLTEIAGLS